MGRTGKSLAAAFVFLLGCERGPLPLPAEPTPPDPPDSPSTPSIMAGEYTLTLRLVSACTNFPDEARVRTYKATITRFGDVLLGDAEFFSNFKYAFISSSGDHANLQISQVVEPNNSSNPGIVEKLREQAHLAIDGAGKGTVGAAGITGTFDGYFEYCPGEATLTGRYYSCVAKNAVGCYTGDQSSEEFTLVPR